MNLIATTPHFHILEKPAGANFHTETGEIGFIVQAEQHLKEKLYPVHRLDKVTSGLLILARSSSAAHDLALLFEKKQIEKYYLALSDKKPKKKQGAISGDMKKGRRGSWMLERTNENPSKTQFFSFGSNSGIRLFVVRPRTGKTHQIRVALKSLGSPIIGDPTYHSKDYAGLDVDRCYLHAYALKFELYDESHRFLKLPDAGYLWEDLNNWSIDLESPWNLRWPQ